MADVHPRLTFSLGYLLDISENSYPYKEIFYRITVGSWIIGKKGGNTVTMSQAGTLEQITFEI